MKRFFITILLISIPFLFFAQNNGRQHRAGEQNHRARKEQMRAQKRVFIEKEVALTESEAAAFFIVLDSYERKIDASKAIQRKAALSINDTSTDEEYEKVIEIIAEQEAKRCELSEEFHSDIEIILSAKKIFLFHKAEKDFNRLLIRGVREK